MTRSTGRRSLQLFPRRTQIGNATPDSLRTRIVNATAKGTERHRLWTSVRFPDLPLAVFAIDPAAAALVVVDGDGTAKTVLACNAAARAAGVCPGLALSAAFALMPEIETVERDARRERQALKRLAAWCIQFTPVVSLEAPAALLLEVRGSLKLFGGLESVCARISGGLEQLGLTAVLGVAPTPLAALWLSRSREPRVVTDIAALPGRVGALPLHCLDWPDRVHATLHGMGLTTVRDCMRLPRDGFARRIGRARLDALDRALGRQPDPRDAYVPPQRFSATLDLPAEVPDIGGLGFALRRLLGELGGFLLGRQSGLQTLVLTLYHQDKPATDVRLGLLAPDRDPARLDALLGERLQRVRLPAPVIALGLRSGRLYALPGSDGDLFGAARESAGAMPQLIERLRARLGTTAASSVCLVPEHRPESAWRSVEPGEVREMPVSVCRPLWLLARPRALDIREGKPYCEGEVRIESGPERIETGWWDGCDVARDYYVAVNVHGMRLWLYRERRAPGRWFLHGIF